MLTVSKFSSQDHLELEDVLLDSVSTAKKGMENLPISEQHSSLGKLDIDLEEKVSLTGERNVAIFLIFQFY